MFKSLAYLEGKEVEFVRGYSQLTELDGTRLPDICKVVKDYENTLLIEMIYVYNEFGQVVPPRKFKKMVSKASMYCGDIVLKAHTYLIGKEIWGGQKQWS